MSEIEDAQLPENVNHGRLTAVALVVGGILLGVVTAIWTIARFAELSLQAEPGPTFAEYVGTAALLLVGWGFGLVMVGVAVLLHRLEDLAQSVESAPRRAVAPLGVPLGEPRAVAIDQNHQAQLLEELVHLTRELREIELLSESDRQARLQAEAEELVRQLELDIPALLREHKLEQAAFRLVRARQRFPSMPQWDVLAEKVEQTRAQFETHDVDVASREIDDLLALGAWDRAERVAQDLRQRHPRAERVSELIRRVAVARDRATADERSRLMSKAQDATTRHEWRVALNHVHEVLKRFPNSPEARDLRLQLPTLEANVEIQTRQEMESQIRDLIKAQRFREALGMSHELIEKYPNSPQASVLREQLPRLEQRAHEAAHRA